MNIGVLRPLPRGVNQRCLGRIADLDHPFGRYELRLAVIVTFILSVVTELCLAVWGFTDNQVQEDPTLGARFTLTFAMAIVFLVLQVASFMIVWEYTQIPHSVIELDDVSRGIELVFRQYSLLLILTQAVYIVYLVLVGVGNLLAAEFLVYACTLLYLVTGLHFVVDASHINEVDKNNRYLKRFPWALILFTFTQFLGCVCLFVATICLAN